MGIFYFQTEVIYFINVFPPSQLNEFNIIVLFKGGGIEIKNVLNSYRIKDVYAVRTGLEPVTPCVTGMYSNQLN